MAPDEDVGQEYRSVGSWMLTFYVALILNVWFNTDYISVHLLRCHRGKWADDVFWFVNLPWAAEGI